MQTVSKIRCLHCTFQESIHRYRSPPMFRSDWPAETARPEEAHQWSPVRWALQVWAWIVLLAAALIAEIFAGPLLAALILALKFGGSDLALGIWLRHRGAPALCYFAWAQAFLKIAVAGFVLAVVITALEPLFGVVFDPFKFAGAMMLLIGGTFLAAVTTAAAAIAALSDQHRLWLDKSANGDFVANRWPLTCSGPRNRVPRLLVLGMVATIAFTLFFAGGMAGVAWQEREWRFLIAVGVLAAIGFTGIRKDAAALREVYVRERSRMETEMQPFGGG